MGDGYHGRKVRIERMNKKLEEDKEVCGNCHSYSKSSQMKGWCMKLRLARTRNDYCGEWS